MMKDCRKLKGKMAEKGYTSKELAKCIGLSEAALHNKMVGKSDFYVSEVIKICEVLNIESVTEKLAIFFN